MQMKAAKAGLPLDDYVDNQIKLKIEMRARREVADARREERKAFQRKEQMDKQQASRDLVSLEHRQAAIRRIKNLEETKK